LATSFFLIFTILDAVAPSLLIFTILNAIIIVVLHL
jgi:hypothetical protein